MFKKKRKIGCLSEKKKILFQSFPFITKINEYYNQKRILSRRKLNFVSLKKHFLEESQKNCLHKLLIINVTYTRIFFFQVDVGHPLTKLGQ